MYLIIFSLAVFFTCLLSFPLLKKTIVLALAYGLAIPLVSIFVYHELGTFDSYIQMKTQAEKKIQLNQAEQFLNDPVALIKKFESHLSQHPDSPKGWYLLGRLYQSQGRFSESIPAFQAYRAYYPNDPQVLNHLAQSLYQLNERKITPIIKHYLEQAKLYTVQTPYEIPDRL